MNLSKKLIATVVIGSMMGVAQAQAPAASAAPA